MSVSLAASEVVVQVHGSALGAHPGAEVSGVVIEAGESARDWLGRSVVVPRLLPCGECGPCLRGRTAVCVSGAGRRQGRRGLPQPQERQEIVPCRYLLPLGPPLLDEARAVPAEEVWRYAALADTVSAPYDGLVRAGVSPGELCVVIGGGSRAAAAVLVARALGCQVVVVGGHAASREALTAAPFGALGALDGGALDPAGAWAAVREIAGRAEVPVHGAVLIETTGTDAGRARALGMIEAGGTAILLDRQDPVGAGQAGPLPAGPGLDGPALLERVCREQGRVLGAPAAHPDLLPELLALVQRAELDLGALTLAVAPTEIEDTLARRRRGEGDAVRLLVARYL
jgi:6-hydroxycyclohex-1-ene-1-carbonyl-CoA dehydrogenase